MSINLAVPFNSIKSHGQLTFNQVFTSFPTPSLVSLLKQQQCWKK